MNTQIKVAGLSAAVVAVTFSVVTFFEGDHPKPYTDPIGVVTECWGHTKTAKLTNVNSREDCLRKLQGDLQDHWAGLERCAPELKQAPERVQAAVLSWGFNVGVGAACRSTLIRKLKAGDIPGACAELSRWTWAGGREWPGLIKRAAAQRAICEGRPASLGSQG